MSEGWLDAFFEALAKLPPRPRFDRIAVADMRPFASIPRAPASSFGGGYLSGALAGIPIVEDESVEDGVIELWDGDEVVERLHLSELRA